MKPVDPLSDDEFTHLVQRAARLPDAPSGLVDAAIALWPATQTVAMCDVTRSALRLIQAVLTFDSWARPAVALGMRALPSATRHLLFSAQGRDIDLRISPAAEHFALSGQILGPDERGVVELTMQSDDQPTVADAHVASLDELGEFRLDGVHGGTYRMTLHMGSDDIVLPPIDVGDRPA